MATVTREEPFEDAVSSRAVTRLRDGAAARVEDCLVVEEPLEVRLGAERFTVTMRTPGDDLDLVRGLLLTEGLISSEEDIGSIRHCDTGEAESSNVITVHLRHPVGRQRLWQRTLMAGTSCGLCGKAAMEAVALAAAPVRNTGVFPREMLLRFSEEMRRRQALFERTGGLHAVGIFDGAGECRALCEDIGRHNATDKAIGRGVRDGWLPWSSATEPLALIASGRASFEIMQKALMARIPVVCSISAASSLAVDLAQENGQTLVGFLRAPGMTVYAGPERVR